MTTASTTLTALRANTAPPPAKPGDDAHELGFFSGPSFNLTYRVASLFARSSLVPKHYQGNEANCMIALNMAHRLGADPLMVMQNLYVVHGTPSWSAQFLIATFNMCGRFSALRYKWSGARGQDDFGCTAWAVETATGRELEGSTITMGLAKKEGWYGKSGSKWQTMPDQMLMYRAAAWFVRAYAPEIAMGLHTAEEMYDMGKNEAGVYEINLPTAHTIEAEAESSSAPDKKSKKAANKPPADQPQAEPNDTPQTRPITHETLVKVTAHLKRLGVPDMLPPSMADRYGTGDPSELTEPQGKDALIELGEMN